MSSSGSSAETTQIPMSPLAEGSEAVAGLVLVFCEAHEAMQPVYLLQRDKVTLGRELDNAIPIRDNSASRYHARVERRADGWWVVDLGSTNGTIVDGLAVQEARLTHGAMLRVGDTLFKHLVRDATAFQAYRIDGSRVAGLSVVQRSTEGGALVGGYHIDRVGEAIEKVAPGKLSVVITGETGTGKELAAREIHRLGGRAGAFQAINCAAIPETLIESELFGFRKGAFTGADRDKAGLFRAADGGTLFLDEIGEMPAEVQVKLLRAIQFGEVQPVGAPGPEVVDVRIVCATNRNLPEEIKTGGFRGDLFARLNEYHIHIPSLRERKEDVYPLARHFLARYGRPDAVLPFSVMLALVHYDWPYNVRELESAVKRCIALAGGGPLDFAHLPDPVRDCLRDYGTKGVPPGRLDEESRPGVEASEPTAAAGPGRGGASATTPSLGQMVDLLQRHKGNVSAMGRELGKDRVQIHRWLKRYGLNPDDYRT